MVFEMTGVERELQLPCGQLLRPVQTLVDTSILPQAKCKRPRSALNLSYSETHASICIDEPMYYRVIITALEVIPASFCYILVPAMPKTRHFFRC